jgi:hypothetical protein
MKPLNSFAFFCFALIVLKIAPCHCSKPSGRDKKYVTVKLNQQFGNQLFEIAAAYAYSLDHRLTLTVPDLVSNREYNIPHNANVLFLHRILCYTPKHPPYHIWTEPNFNYNPIPDSSRIELRGYFQSEKYFAHRRKEILELFSAPEGMNERIIAKYPFLKSDQLVVGVQVRYSLRERPRGEYHPNVDRRYYEKAIPLFPKDAIFVVTSDNREFAKECVDGLAENLVYLEADYIEEFYTLALCKSFIISNSSFGWWAAWLSTAENKRVVVPNPWFSLPYDNDQMIKDLFPDNFKVILWKNP